LCICEGGSRSVIRVEDGRGEGGQVVLAGTKLFRFPGVGKSLGVKLRVTEHFLQACVIEGAVGGRIQSVLWEGGRGLSQWGRVGGGTCLGRGGGA